MSGIEERLNFLKDLDEKSKVDLYYLIEDLKSLFSEGVTGTKGNWSWIRPIKISTEEKNKRLEEAFKLLNIMIEKLNER